MTDGKPALVWIKGLTLQSREAIIEINDDSVQRRIYVLGGVELKLRESWGVLNL